MAAIIKSFYKQVSRKRAAPCAWVVATAASLLSPNTCAADWQFLPTLGILGTYSDNVALASAGAERSDFITQVSPGLKFAHAGREFKVKGNYVMNNLAYAKARDDITTFHLFDATANAELLNNLFFLDATASVNQQNISAFGPQTTDNLNLTGNRTEVRTYSLSPSIRHRFGSMASAELRYTQESATTSAAGLRPSDTARIRLNINSGSAFRTLGWGANYSKQTLQFENAGDIDLETSSATLRYVLSPRLMLSATGGYERNTYVSAGEKPEGYFWLAGFTWTPSQRTLIDAKAGNRFYGKTYSVTASHRARKSVWSFGYNEDISTTPSQFVLPVTINTSDFLNDLWKTSIPDANTRQQVVDSFIRDTGLPGALAQNVNTLTNRVFLQKGLHASVALNGIRNTVVFSLFNTAREAQSPGQIDNALLGASNALLEENSRQRGGTAVWNWRMTQRTSLNVSLAHTQARSLSAGRTDNNKTARVALTAQFQPKLKGTVEVRKRHQDSNSTIGNIRENAIAASILMSF